MSSCLRTGGLLLSLFNTPETSAPNRAHSQRQNSVCIVVILQLDPVYEALSRNTWRSDRWSGNDHTWWRLEKLYLEVSGWLCKFESWQGEKEPGKLPNLFLRATVYSNFKDQPEKRQYPFCHSVDRQSPFCGVIWWSDASWWSDFPFGLLLLLGMDNHSDVFKHSRHMNYTGMSLINPVKICLHTLRHHQRNLDSTQCCLDTFMYQELF